MLLIATITLIFAAAVLAGYYAGRTTSLRELKRESYAPGPDFPETPSGYILIPQFIYNTMNGIEKNAIYDAHERFQKSVRKGCHYVTYRKDGRMASDPYKVKRQMKETA